ncbi:MAG: low specificity L-threonine aldolase, partial [Gaiellales bacterium]
TNIVLATVADGTRAADLVEELARVGVLCADLSERTVRFVTHLDVGREAVELALELADPVLS